ncbi:hypothetical protein JOD29_003115 [Lysinibacillus composti]|uniref:S-layer homology domain-containing protein n=1 Tax=Lysinibacillus composti TaxID=720633 RepID=A0A3N9UAM4_9BACI|nr:S-layer homology domain-containing protein [Lysinibacillus composti]MBM7609839.1 hypothetical protein [Lysinibacillus composti]RQW73609.1 S-layer homology domain-containing protein [Lysinibacillus composti]
MKKLTKIFSTAGLACTVLFSSISGASATTVHYNDINKDDNFYNSVDYLLEQNAISRTLPKFRPYENITRGQFASIFAKVLGLDVANTANPHFKDVSTTHQFYPYVSALQNEGILGGKVDGTFGINDPLTRGQMAGILTKAYGILLLDDEGYGSIRNIYGTESDYRYANDIYNGYSYNEGQWNDDLGTLEYLGIMIGYGDGNMYPNKPINRSQFANMIYKVEQKGIKDYHYQSYNDLRKQISDLGLSIEDVNKSLEEFLNDKAIFEWADASITSKINGSYQSTIYAKIIAEGEMIFEDLRLIIELKKDNTKPKGWWISVDRYATAAVEEPTTTDDTSTVETTVTE